MCGDAFYSPWGLLKQQQNKLQLQCSIKQKHGSEKRNESYGEGLFLASRKQTTGKQLKKEKGKTGLGDCVQRVRRADPEWSRVVETAL